MLLKKQTAWLIMGCLVLVACGHAPNPELPATEEQVRRYDAVAILLRQAERDLGRDRLMTPASGNAYDRFQAVLMMAPNHPQAVSGLQQILIRYVELGRQALRKNDITAARRMLKSAQLIDNRNPLVEEFSGTLHEAERAQKAVVGEVEYVLDGSDLSARNQAVRETLNGVARRLLDSGKSVLIVARNDAEGRWLYKSLRQAASGQRIRGDIKIGAVPRIVLLPPL